MIQIAIDGPSGSGKSSIAKIVAKTLNLTYLDTGAMYRAVTLYLMENAIQLTDQNTVEAALEQITITMDQRRTLLNGRDVSEDIRAPHIDQNVSLVSSYPFVRMRLVALQQQIAQSKSVILDGRDIGTVVLPNAPVKVFLTASSEVRAKRRIEDYMQKGIDITYEEVLADIIRRDHLDSTREASPLSIPRGAVVLDTSDMTFNEVVDRLIMTIKETYHGTDFH